MRVIGLTNKLGSNLRLFMWEYDNVSEYEALEIANLLCQMFNVDIDVLRSSVGHFHLVSFDILSLKTVQRMQIWAEDGLEGDYLNIMEMPLFDEKGLWNTLRVGSKFAKPSPKFIKRFLTLDNPRLKSLRHFRFYQWFCRNPDFPLRYHDLLVSLDLMISVYNTGIGTKPKKSRDIANLK